MRQTIREAQLRRVRKEAEREAHATEVLQLRLAAQRERRRRDVLLEEQLQHNKPDNREPTDE